MALQALPTAGVSILHLSKTERAAIMGFYQREREIQEKLLQPLQTEYREVIAEIESRCGLSPGAIGMDYTLLADEGIIRRNPQHEQPETPADAEPPDQDAQAEA